MPTVRFEEPWVPGFRSAVRTSAAEGWSVREHRGGMRLQVRHQGGSMQTVALPGVTPIRWTVIRASRW